MIGWQSSDLLCVRGEERQAKKGQCGGLGDAYSKAENMFKEKTGQRLTVGEEFQTIGFLIRAFLISDNLH